MIAWLTEYVDDTFIARLEQDEQILDQHPQCHDVHPVVQIVEVELWEGKKSSFLEAEKGDTNSAFAEGVNHLLNHLCFP